MADKEFLEYVVKAIVDNPSAVTVDRKVDEMGVLITLKTDPADMGKVIGRSGNTYQGYQNSFESRGHEEQRASQSQD